MEVENLILCSFNHFLTNMASFIAKHVLILPNKMGLPKGN